MTSIDVVPHSVPDGWMSRAANGLSLAATPTFAILALLTGGGAADMLCLHGASPLGGMSLMYGLMSAFHMAPWLRLISRHRAPPHR
jgi:hypothetical protein